MSHGAADSAEQQRSARLQSARRPSTRLRALALCAGIAAAVVVAAAAWSAAPHAVQAAENPPLPAPVAVAPLQNPDRACAGCHRAIYDHYEQSSMARGSGLVTAALLPGSFHHTASGVDYSVFAQNTPSGSAAWMRYTRSSSTEPLAGQRQLQYSIGSGHRGRTYLYAQGGEWFELPINYYARRSRWAMAPAFDDATHMPMLPVEPNCLHCHTSLVQEPLPGARNHFAGAPFQQGGIGCAACHGDATAHLASQGKVAMVDPGKLAPKLRDSACIQCHLEGDAIVYRPGRELAHFKPGEDLADVAVYFVRASQQTGGARATSQYEALLHSACKRASGDRLTCTSCHDPHGDPPPAERVAWFRARCLSCHTGPAMATHHLEQPDCATCHMPSRSTADISHEQVTDHDIEARPPHHIDSGAVHVLGDEELVPVGWAAVGDRELGLAYAQIAARGNRLDGERALQLLTRAAAAGAHDAELETRLGYLQQISGQSTAARASYAAALAADPQEPSALANLAVLEAQSGNVGHAVELLQRLVAADPSQTAAGLNLAYVQCKLGDTEAARTLLTRLAEFNPDDPTLREFRRHGSYAGAHCELAPNTTTSR